MGRPNQLFDRAQSQSLPELVRRELQKAIEENRVGPGDRLPSERELAQQFDVSRVVVREALSALEATHTIEIRRHRGAFVRDRPSSTLRTSWPGWLAAHRSELVELLTIRQALESLAAGQAARKRRRSDITVLTGLCERFEQELATSAPSIDRLVELDIEFHRRIASVAGGALLPQLVDELVGVLRDPPATFVAPGRGEITARDHRAILDAIIAKDADAAAVAMLDHLAHIIELVAKAAQQARRRAQGRSKADGSSAR